MLPLLVMCFTWCIYLMIFLGGLKGLAFYLSEQRSWQSFSCLIQTRQLYLFLLHLTLLEDEAESIDSSTPLHLHFLLAHFGTM